MTLRLLRHLLLGTLWFACLASHAAPADVAPGETIYRQGVLPNGDPLRGRRDAGTGLEGPAAACMTCHRPSGLGTTEGRIVVPPIIGKYLFRSHATNVKDMDLPHLPGYRSTRDPYTDETLARAIREGIGPNGRTLSDLMPRYALDDAAMTALTGYLRAKGAEPVPGVSDDTLHFATIITPDADRAQRQAVLAVMAQFFADKNAFIRGGARPMQATREVEYRVSRRWQLHVWDLTGPPEQWEGQLAAHLAAEPVFAVISGLGGPTWDPVHRFCQAQRLPCLLPNVDLPPVAESDFYPVYFSRGVLLESDLIAARIGEERASHPVRRVVQLFRRGDVGERAARALAATMATAGVPVDLRALAAEPGTRQDVAKALDGLGEGDLLVAWLRPQDLQALPGRPPALAGALVSGLMGGMEHAPLPPAWRGTARMSYPADLPEARAIRMNYPLAWFRIRQIPVVAERVQSDTYIACGILAETLTDMLDSFVRDYLVERVETMLSHRLLNGYYPRLSLAPGQRFASKGGYVVRFADAASGGIVADGDWTAP